MMIDSYNNRSKVSCCKEKVVSFLLFEYNVPVSLTVAAKDISAVNCTRSPRDIKRNDVNRSVSSGHKKRAVKRTRSARDIKRSAVNRTRSAWDIK